MRKIKPGIALEWQPKWKGLCMRRWLVWLCCLLPMSLHAEVFWGVLKHVSDGDTFWVMPDGGRAPEKLRLLGLDAPEICQAGGVASRDALQILVTNKRLRVTVNFQDKYGRGLARVWVDGQDVGALMVQSGQAWSSRWHHKLGPYARQEVQARIAHLGVFADSAAEWPGDFRKHFGSCYPTR
jgi:endonuclease YncB( thermonuclease family)